MTGKTYLALVRFCEPFGFIFKQDRVSVKDKGSCGVGDDLSIRRGSLMVGIASRARRVNKERVEHEMKKPKIIAKRFF